MTLALIQRRGAALCNHLHVKSAHLMGVSNGGLTPSPFVTKEVCKTRNYVATMCQPVHVAAASLFEPAASLGQCI